MKKKLVSCFIIFIVIISIIVCYIIFFRKDMNSTLDKYQEASQTILKPYQKEISEYNKTLDLMASSSYFDAQHIPTYQEITYQETPNFEQKIALLLEKNYNATEINQIFEYLSDTNIEKLLQKEHQSLESFYQITNLNIDKLEEYKAYQAEKQIELKNAVTEVNLHLNIPFYSEIKEIENPSELTVLVNKYNALPEDYEPSDLVNIGSTSQKMRKVAAEALEQLMAKAATENITLIPFSTYRSYEYQKKLYENYGTQDSFDVVDTYSARPGHSEHQTGLAVDIRSDELIDNVTESDYNWLLNHAHEFGFIIRYPKGNSEITGYIEEPWHLRYIGNEHAQKVHELNITYDEYYDLYLTKY